MLVNLNDYEVVILFEKFLFFRDSLFEQYPFVIITNNNIRVSKVVRNCGYVVKLDVSWESICKF